MFLYRQKKILLKEFKRGREITFAIENGKKNWEELIDQFPFWEKYNFYLRVDCKAKTEEDHRRWVGYVESRIRFLKLENTVGVKYVHPHPGPFEYKEENWPFVSAFFLGLKIDIKLTKERGVNVDLTLAVIDFSRGINDWREKTEGMEINVNLIKRSQLPDFVFGDKPRPTAPPKKRKRKSTPGNNKKPKSNTTPNSTPPPTPTPNNNSTPPNNSTPNNSTPNNSTPNSTTANNSTPPTPTTTSTSTPV